MRRPLLWTRLTPSIRLLTFGALLACGSSKSGGEAAGSAGNGQIAAAGAGGASGGSAGQGAGASAGATATRAEASGGTSSGNADGASFQFDPQPACSSPAVACNGACLDPGASANGCVYLTRVQSLDGLAVSGGDVFASLSFPFGPHAEQPPPFGLYRIDGTTLQLTPLDTSGVSGASIITVASDTIYYMKPGTTSNGFIRSVPASGGTPVELVTAIEDGRALWASGERLYFSAALQSENGSEAVHWLPIAGGSDPQTTQLSGAARVRFSQTTVVTSFNGNIETAPLPDLAPVTSLMGDFALPLDQWWIDDQYVYWDKDGSYKRSPLTRLGAKEADGELVTTLPSGMSVQADVGSELFLSATVDGVTGLFVMPIDGGTPTQIAIVGAPGPRLLAADADRVYVSSGFGLLRIDRP